MAAKSKRHERTLARRAALQVLYQSDILDAPATGIVSDERYLADNEEGPLSEYARELLCAVEDHRAQIDERLAATSENWSVARMPVVDRSILRLAVCEMAYIDDVPVSVAINEAVELAKDFGGEDDSPRFVNGVLGRIATMLEEEQGGDGSGEGAVDGEPVAECAPESAEPASAEAEAPATGTEPEEARDGE